MLSEIMSKVAHGPTAACAGVKSEEPQLERANKSIENEGAKTNFLLIFFSST